MRNANSKLAKAFETVKNIKEICLQNNKELVVYLSMCFGNPYGDFWDESIVEHWTDRFAQMGIQIISLSDTIGIANPKQIAQIFKQLTTCFPKVEFGAHLHTEAHNWKEKVEAAYQNGCSRFDGAIKGFGGCPMAQNKLVGNMPTENLVDFFIEERADFFIDNNAFVDAQKIANDVFMTHS